jgi:hypothetical protein
MGKWWLRVFVMAVVCGSGCNLPDPHAQQASVYSGPVAAAVIRAEVPEGFGGPGSLGMPLDENFEPLIGGDGGSLFPQAGQPTFQWVNQFSSQRQLVGSSQELKANAHAWFVNASVTTSKQQTFAYYRAFQIVGVWQLNETSPMIRPPAPARYYADQVFYGHSYSLVIRGESQQVSEAIGASWGPFGGSLGEWQKHYHVIATAAGHGLIPNGPDSIFAPPERTSAYYRAAPDHQADAIIVHYREIPPVPPAAP